MKKIILMFAVCGALVTAQAQANRKPDPEKMNTYNTGLSVTTYTKTPVQKEKMSMMVPEKVKEAFMETHKDTKVTWKKEGEDFRATFMSNDKEPLERIVLYDKNGNVLLTEKEMMCNASPSEIGKYCDQHKLGKNPMVWEVDSKTASRKYFVVHEGKTIWFDRDGKHIGKETHVARHRPEYYK